VRGQKHLAGGSLYVFELIRNTVPFASAIFRSFTTF
jgi:hypothetical protein